MRRALLLLVIFASVASAQDGLDPGELVKNERAVAANSFNVSRDRADYEHTLDPGLASDIETWREGMRILDGGAGLAGFLRDVAAALPSKPELIAVSVARPDKLYAIPEGVTYVEGELGAAGFPLEHRIGVGTIDRIVEDYGASHYADFDRVLESYGLLLKAGGRVYLHVDPNNTKLLDKDGAPLSVASYLRRLGGMKLVHSGFRSDPVNSGQTHLVVVLERTAETLSVPPLELVRFTSYPPPKRVYASGLAARSAPEDGLAAALARVKEIAREALGTGWFVPARRRAVAPSADMKVLSRSDLEELERSASRGIVDRLEGRSSLLEERVRGAVTRDRAKER